MSVMEKLKRVRNGSQVEVSKMGTKEVANVLLEYFRFPPPNHAWIRLPKDVDFCEKMEDSLSKRGFLIVNSFRDLNFEDHYCLMSAKPILASAWFKAKYPVIVRSLRSIVGSEKEKEVLSTIGLLQNGMLRDKFFLMLFADDMEMVSFFHGFGLTYGCTTLLPPRMVTAEDLLYEFKHETSDYHDVFCKTAMLIVAYPFSCGLFDSRNSTKMVSFMRKRLLQENITILADVYADNGEMKSASDSKSIREAFFSSALIRDTGLSEDSSVLQFVKKSVTLCVSPSVVPFAESPVDCGWLAPEFLFSSGEEEICE